MESRILQAEIDTIRLHLQAISEKFDIAIDTDKELKDAKKLYQEIRILRERLDELNRQNGGIS